MGTKQKYYVVWKGYTPGVYSTWEACKQQIDGFAGAWYKSFLTAEDAQTAYENPHLAQLLDKDKSDQGRTKSLISKRFIEIPSISVDAGCSGNPGNMEYQGVDTDSGKLLFHIGPMWGTNNIGEFLAIVHGLAYLKQNNSTIPIYSDSVNAIGWIKKKKCATKLVRDNKSLKAWQLIERAELWLKQNTWQNRIIKWETESWGQIPADFGRK